MIAFVRDHQGLLQIYVMNADGSERRRLTQRRP
jgi:Tol biopolymer transport system component